jgi:hypothetical protein
MRGYTNQTTKIVQKLAIQTTEIVQVDVAINSSFNFKTKHFGHPIKIYNAPVTLVFYTNIFKKKYDSFLLLCYFLSLLELNIHSDFEEKLY